MPNDKGSSVHRSRIGGLDLLRLLAALAVVFFHLCFRGTAGQGLSTVGFPEVAEIAKYGYLGLDLFFIISGFVIAASARGRTWSEFAIARAGRLYPAFVVCMTTTALVIALAGMAPHAVTVRQWLANLTMLAPWLGERHVDGSYWSIVCEIIFYAWFALLIRLGWQEERLPFVIVAWLAICAVNELIVQSTAVSIALVTDYGPLFASGVLIERIWQGDRSRIVLGLLAAAFVLAGTHAFTMVGEFRTYYDHALDARVLLMLHIGVYVLFVGALWGSRFIAPTPLVLALGGVTYPLYLLHHTIGFIALNRLAPLIGRWQALAVIVVGLVLAAWAVWRYVEPTGRPLVTGALRSIAGRFRQRRVLGR